MTLSTAFISTARAATLTLDNLVRSVGSINTTAGNTPAGPTGGDYDIPNAIPFLEVDTLGNFTQDFSQHAGVNFASVDSLISQHSTITAGPDSLHVSAELHATNSALMTNDGPVVVDANNDYVRGGHYGFGYLNASAYLRFSFTIDAPFTLTLFVATNGNLPTAFGGSEFSLFNGSLSGDGPNFGYGRPYNAEFVSTNFLAASGTPGTITLVLDAGSYWVSAAANDTNGTPALLLPGDMVLGAANFTVTRGMNFTMDLRPVAVPEPSPWALLLGGVGMFAGCKRFVRRTQA